MTTDQTTSLFDEQAIEAAGDAFRRCEYDTASSVKAALHAAEASLRERGLAVEAGAFESTYDGLIARTLFHPQHTTPVTIIKRTTA